MHLYKMSESDLLTRLKRIEGQVRGIQKMIEEDRYCVDVLSQISAIKAALTKVELALLESHTRGCVGDAMCHEGEDDRNGKIDELMKVIEAFVK